MSRCPHCGGRPITWPLQSILDACHAWNDDHGQPPTAADWRASTPAHPSDSIVRRTFGSWNKMLSAAGYEPRRAARPVNARWTRESVVAAIFRFRFEHGRVPRCRDWKRQTDTNPSVQQIRRLFGSFAGALVSAGYEPEYARRSKRQLRAVAANVTKVTP